ncbi:MAG: DUF1501 domain-containing protein [Bacteroidia bacterium]|nr:DUF1501 domain-containing protein [Bacteroidia bacterium]
MNRRSFIFRSAAAATLPVLLNGFPVRAWARNKRLAALTGLDTETDRVLVLVQLNGGNDGLNTVLPLDQYSSLARARANILIPDTQALLLEGNAGLHPAMSGMHSLFQEKLLAVVQSAGYPNPNFSHFRATDIWTSASDADEVVTSGWLGRYLDTEYPGFPEGYPSAEFPDPPAITIGSVLSATCQGPVMNMGLAITDPDNVTELLNGGSDEIPNSRYGYELNFLRQTVRQTNQYLDVIQDASGMGQNLSPLYPEAGANRLADQLKIVARLIAGGLKTRVYVVGIGGFDTHANQVDSSDNTQGNHAALLRNVSDAIAAFQDDLGKLGLADRVVGMTFSEFGRRIKSNASLGTDHGSAAPLFVFGSQVNSKVFGTTPVIPSSVTDQDNLPMQHDFRSVYASLLQDWFSVPAETIQAVLFDEFQYIPLIRKPGSTPEIGDVPVLMPLQPNPFFSTAKLVFQTPGGRVQIRLFDGSGRTVALVTDQEFDRGEYELPFDGSALAEGAYYLRLQQGSHQAMQMVWKRAQ